MPLIVGSKTFTKPLKPSRTLIQAMNETSKLPEPTVIPYQESKATAANTVISVQREILRNRFSLPGKKIHYFGTKFLRTCIMVCLYNENEAEAIHWDSTPYTGLTDDIRSFSGKEIFVSLVGGKAANTASKLTLHTILTELSKAAHATGKTIIVKDQLLFERNMLREQDKPADIYNELKYCISVLYQQIYGKTIPEEYFAAFNLDSFTKDIVSEEPDRANALMICVSRVLMDTAVFYSSDAEWSRFKQGWEVLGRYQRKEYLTPAEQKAFAAHRFPTAERPHPMKEEDFLSLMRLVFTKQGYKLVKDYKDKGARYTDVRLDSCVFDCVTHNFTVIDTRMSTPYEELRLAACMEPHVRSQYHCYYDNQRAEKEKLPILSPAYRNAILTCDFLPRTGMLLTSSQRNALIKIFHFPADVPLGFIFFAFNIVCWAFKNRINLITYDAKSAAPIKLAPDSLCAPKAPLCLTDWYKPDEFKDQTTNSIILKNLTSHTFILKARTSPEWTVDALLPLSQLGGSEQQLQATAECLRINKISFTIREFADLGKCLCVEAININENAGNIQNAGAKLGVGSHMAADAKKSSANVAGPAAPKL